MGMESTGIHDEAIRATIRPEWFWSRVEVGGPDECWPWRLATDSKGYGRIHLTVKGLPVDVSAHRAAYLLGTGKALGSLLTLHHCDNPPCCNFRQCLWAGTHQDNMADAARKLRLKISALTGADVQEMRRRYTLGGVMQKTLAAEYGISTTHANYILRGLRLTRLAEQNTNATSQVRALSPPAS